MDSSSWPQNFGNSSNGQTRTTYTTSSSSSNNNGAPSSFEGFPSFKSLSQPSSFSHTESFSSDSTNESKMFYVASVSNGLVLAHQENGRPSGVVAENKGDRGDEQKWTIEYGDETNIIALKCAANGKYLHCFEGKGFGKVGTGDKQWWRISDDEVTPPGACRLGSVDYPEYFLNHHNGDNVRKGNGGTKLHMYKWEKNNERHTTWYITDASASFNPAVSSSSSSSASKADFDSKLKALEDREATLTQKDNDRSAEHGKKMKELQERQESLAQEEKDRAASYDEKLKDLQSREAELAKKEDQQKLKEAESSQAEKEEQQQSPEVESSKADNSNEDDEKAQADKEAEIQHKLDDLKSTEQKIAADQASLGKSKADFNAKLEWFKQRQKSFEDLKSSAQHDAVQAKKDLEARQKELEDQSKKASASKKASPSQNAPKADPNGSNGSQNGNTQKKASQNQNAPKTDQNGTSASQDEDLERKQRENAALEKRLAKLEDQLAQMNAAESKPEKPQTNGKASTGTLGCGHKHYKPPRKINRKVIGLVYE